jgi:hypothetical protein
MRSSTVPGPERRGCPDQGTEEVILGASGPTGRPEAGQGCGRIRQRRSAGLRGRDDGQDGVGQAPTHPAHRGGTAGPACPPHADARGRCCAGARSSGASGRRSQPGWHGRSPSACRRCCRTPPLRTAGRSDRGPPHRGRRGMADRARLRPRRPDRPADPARTGTCGRVRLPGRPPNLAAAVRALPTRVRVHRVGRGAAMAKGLSTPIPLRSGHPADEPPTGAAADRPVGRPGPRVR